MGKPVSGGARAKLAGKAGITLAVTREQHEILRAAAKKENRPVSQFLVHHALTAAEKILEK